MKIIFFIYLAASCGFQVNDGIQFYLIDTKISKCMFFNLHKNRLVKNAVLVLLLLLQNALFAQSALDSLEVKINVNFNGKAVVLGENYISSNSDNLKFENIKFYLSAFEIKYKDFTVSNEKESYHLIDLKKAETMNFKLPLNSIQEVESLQFNVGIDSFASVSGVMGGDLDPVNAMYWAWKSGFVNFKIEGTSPSCITRKNKFQFHIGGYLKPNYAMRMVDLTVGKNNLKTITINVDLGKVFSAIQLKEMNTIMIPGAEAMKMADLFQTTFSLE